MAGKEEREAGREATVAVVGLCGEWGAVACGSPFAGRVTIECTLLCTSRAGSMERVAATPSFLLALLVAIAYSADRTVLNGRILTLEAERDSLHSRVDLVERAFTSLLAQTSTAAALPERRLQDTTGPTVSANQTRATVLVDAPDGVSEVIFGGEAAADNVVLHKSHQRDGAQFTLSRNDKQVLRVDPDGAFMVLTDPLQVPSAVSSASGAPLELRSAGNGVSLQDLRTHHLHEVDGTAAWSASSALVFTGDTISWTWTNYHNVVEINEAGAIVSSGVSSGEPELASSFSHTFALPGLYWFKSQVADEMRTRVEVRELFAVRNGTMSMGGDMEVKGAISGNGALRLEGDLEVSGELLLGGVRLSAAMLSGMIQNAGPLPPPTTPPSPPSAPPSFQEFSWGTSCEHWNGCQSIATAADCEAAASLVFPGSRTYAGVDSTNSAPSGCYRPGSGGQSGTYRYNSRLGSKIECTYSYNCVCLC